MIGISCIVLVVQCKWTVLFVLGLFVGVGSGLTFLMMFSLHLLRMTILLAWTLAVLARVPMVVLGFLRCRVWSFSRLVVVIVSMFLW